ncbi:MAG: conjugative transposon protein TraM [Prolixibacteraceae bacterium]|jgi:conjugative transposon TraM protein|nr:conjugative transposon protein TraM [Prolixibacteraceae bacterium]
MKNYLKKNKGLFLLPLGLIPFLILIFYVLGGGKDGEQDQQQQAQAADGANYVLPEAEKSIGIMDKMEAYQQGATENELANVQLREDSIEIQQAPVDSTQEELSLLAQQNQKLPENLLAHIKQKEKEARKELAEPGQKKESRPVPPKQHPGFPAKRQNTEPKKDPVKQVTGIEELDKVFDENRTLNRQNDSLKFYLQQSQNRLEQIEKAQNASFSLDKKTNVGFNQNEEKSKLIKAEIYETATVLDGNRVKLRLLEDTRINGQEVPENTFIYGICKVRNERLHIEINQMPVGEGFLPVKLAIHDLDGMPGLYVPDNVARKVTQEVGGSTNTSSLFGMTDDPLTYAGIRAADRTTQILLKRVRLKKVTVRKNTMVYLINQN